MGRLLLIAAITAHAVLGVLAQGTVNFINLTGTSMLTNAVAVFGTSGNTAPTPGGFYYELLVAPSTVTSVDLSLQELLSAPWSDTGLLGTNTAFAPGGRMSAGGLRVVNNWAPFVMESFVVVGWSANEGSSWATVASRLAGTQYSFNNGSPYFDDTFSGLIDGGFIGASTVQQGEAGQEDGTVAFGIFGSTGSAQGTPITTPTTMYAIASIPEPSAIGLFALGSCVLLRKRR